MEPSNNLNFDLYRLNWNKILEEGAYKGHQIEELASAMADKDASQLKYNSKLKTVSYGLFILNLNHLAKPDNSISFSYLSHCVISNLSEGYLKVHRNQINRLAYLIKEKLELDKFYDRNNHLVVPLIENVKSNNIEGVKRFIEAGADVNVEDEDKKTPLYTAIVSEVTNYELIKYLIQAGADVNKGSSLFISACYRDHVLVQLLVDAGAKVTPLGLAMCFQNYERVQELINSGADVNSSIDARGTLPLEMAILLQDPKLLLQLIEAKVDINQVDIQGFSPLSSAIFMANDQGDLTFIKILIKGGADVNYPDKGGTTPLMMAIKLENLSIVKTLVAFGADVNKLDKDGDLPIITALYSNKEFEVINFLLDAGTDFMKLDKSNWSMLDRMMFRVRSEEKNQMIIDLIKKINPETKVRHKELKARLSIAHLWHLSGSTSLYHPDKTLTTSILNLEGGTVPFWMRKLQKNLRRNPNIIKNQETLENALKHVVYRLRQGIQFSNEEVLNRIQAGLETIIQTGFSGNDLDDHGHAVTVVCLEDQMVFCNRGAASRRPLEIYHYDRKALTPEIIGKIRNNSSKKEYIELFFNILPKTLKFSQTNLDKLLEKIASIYLPDQTVGNCSWLSPITGIFAHQLLSGVKGEHEGIVQNEIPKDLFITITTQVNYYRSWLGNELITSLEQMMRQVEKKDYEPDHLLIQNALRKAHSLVFEPNLTDRLTTLTDAYIACLTKPQALEFKTNLQMWKMAARMDFL